MAHELDDAIDLPECKICGTHAGGIVGMVAKHSGHLFGKPPDLGAFVRGVTAEANDRIAENMTVLAPRTIQRLGYRVVTESEVERHLLHCSSDADRVNGTR